MNQYHSNITSIPQKGRGMETHGYTINFLTEYLLLNKYKDKSVIAIYHNDEFEMNKFKKFIRDHCDIIEFFKDHDHFKNNEEEIAILHPKMVETPNELHKFEDLFSEFSGAHILILSFDDVTEAKHFWDKYIPDGNLHGLEFPYCSLRINGKKSGENT